VPSYEYRCESCKSSQFISRGILEKEIVPKCSGCNLLLIRVYSPVGVTFSGGGFYSTDNKG
jgi:putative FmdB family regulatory protein